MRRWLMILLLCLLPWAAQGEGMERLENLPILTAQQAALLPEACGPVELTFHGVKLPYDERGNRYLIPQTAPYALTAGAVKIVREEGYHYSLLPGNDSLSIVGRMGDTCIASDLVYTSLPVLEIRTDHGLLPDEADTPGRFVLLEAETGRLNLKTGSLEINLRGNTSKRLPKKSYRIKLLDEAGEKRNLSIAGLRSDDDWILNPLYADCTKIREKLAYDLWDAMNTSGTAAASSRMEYAEVILNGTYWGLYGVQERIDRKQVDASKRSGILYKIAANDRPTVEELLLCENREACRGMELVYAGAMVTDPWEPAAGLIRYLDGGEAGKTRMVLENSIDYGIWAMVTQAHDCHFKNQYVNAVYEGSGYQLYKMPWDLNNTFGDVWREGKKENNYTEYQIGKLVMDSAFERLLTSEDENVMHEVQRRWRTLREELLTAQRLHEYAENLFASIHDALIRDGQRWPECGRGAGNTDSVEEIWFFMDEMLLRMDVWVESLI